MLVLLVKSAMVESPDDTIPWSDEIPRAVLLVKRATVERPELTTPWSDETPRAVLLVKIATVERPDEILVFVRGKKKLLVLLVKRATEERPELTTPWREETARLTLRTVETVILES